MPIIPLVEYTRPRILMVDFAPPDIAKFANVGFEARRGATGIHDRNEFCIPFATQDVEVMFARVENGSFAGEERIASKESVEEKPFFRDVVRETWEKAGWVVLFVSQDTSPGELSALGLESVGVIARGHMHWPESIHETLQKGLEEARSLGQLSEVELPPPRLPRFRGHEVHVSAQPEVEVVQRYLKSARMSVLTCLSHPLGHDSIRDTPQPHIFAFGKARRIEWLVRDDSADRNVTALKISSDLYIGKDGDQSIYHRGGVLLLPDFGDNDGNAALALLSEVFTQTSPHLFDQPQHPWLEKYQPATVRRLQAERALEIDKTMQKLTQIDQQMEAERQKFGWLPGMLVSTGDQFTADVAAALRFLGFEVEEVDNGLATGERRREDYHIWDKVAGYFSIGEAKTAGKGRGAAEDFISKTQTHQTRFARDQKQVPPLALLIVNYAIDLDPARWKSAARRLMLPTSESSGCQDLTFPDTIGLVKTPPIIVPDRPVAKPVLGFNHQRRMSCWRSQQAPATAKRWNRLATI